jgi:hypothetical protein
MDEVQYAAAIDLHARTNHQKAMTAAQCGNWEEAQRCTSVAVMAGSGRLLTPTANESSIPDLVAAAAERGLLVDAPAPQPMPLDLCQAAIKRHGASHRLMQQAATMNGDHGEAQRLHVIALAAEKGTMLASDKGAAHLSAAAAVHGLLVNASGAPVAHQPTEPVTERYHPNRLGGQPLGPKLTGQT